MGEWGKGEGGISRWNRLLHKTMSSEGSTGQVGRMEWEKVSTLNTELFPNIDPSLSFP